MVQLLATTALIMGGTEHPLVQSNHDGVSNDSLTADEQWVRDYLDAMQDNYLEPTEGDREDESNEPYRLVAVYTPEEFFPVVGSKTFDDSVAEGADNLDGCMTTGCDSHVVTEPDPGVSDDWVIVGYSQSARIASMEKQRLIDEYRDDWIAGEPTPDVSFLLLSNPNRPNGGVLMRFHGLTIPFLGVTMDGATPTDSCEGDTCHLPTVDVAQQYDALGGDFPLYPLNLLATLNSLAAYLMLHGDMPYAGMDEVDEDQGQFGDTHYYMVGADILPLLMPLEQLGVPRALLRVIDAPLRVLIETAYRRDISPGEPVPAQLVPVINPVSLLANLLASIPIGIDDGIEEVTGERPLGTQPAGIYGVGGEDEDLEGAPVGFIPLGKPDPTTSTEVEPPAETGSLTAGTELTGTEGSATQAAVPAAAGTPEAPKADVPKADVPKAQEEPRSRGNLQTFFRQRNNAEEEQEGPKQRSGDRPGSHLRNFVKRLTGQRPARSNPATTSGSDDVKSDDPSDSSVNKDAAA